MGDLVKLRKREITDLVLPGYIKDDIRTADHYLWLSEVVELLGQNKLQWSLQQEELGLAVRRHPKGRSAQWLVFDATESAMIPPAVWIQQVLQWADGSFTPDNIYRILSPAEQIRISNRTGQKPLAEVRQDTLGNELAARDDMRRQGLDPDKEIK